MYPPPFLDLEGLGLLILEISMDSKGLWPWISKDFNGFKALVGGPKNSPAGN